MENLEENVIMINFVYSACEKSIKDFLRKIPDTAEYISYLEIYNKLSKNDFYQCDPSDEVITSYLIKQLNHLLSKNVSNLYYVISTIDKETLIKIQSFISSMSNSKVIFNIYHSPSSYLNGTSKLFNSSFIF